jgi:F420H(2)-dependent quinone reductase
MSKVIFSIINFLYRFTGGRIGGQMNGREVLLLTTTGCKTGKQRTVPLIYIMDGSSYVITASNSGANRNPGWFFNVKSNPQATILIRDKQIKVTAEVTEPEKKRALWAQLLQVAPFYAGYQQRTSRDIPMVILHPVDERV